MGRGGEVDLLFAREGALAIEHAPIELLHFESARGAFDGVLDRLFDASDAQRDGHPEGRGGAVILMARVCVARTAGGRHLAGAWLAQGRGEAPPSAGWAWRWGGLVLLLIASCALEWTRLYGWEARLPGHAGGVLGWWLGPLSMKLGFVYSGVLWISLLVLALPMALRFSWLRLADSVRRPRASVRSAPRLFGAPFSVVAGGRRRSPRMP